MNPNQNRTQTTSKVGDALQQILSLCACTKKSHGLLLTRLHCIEMSPMQCVLNVVFCTQRTIKTSGLVMMDVVLVPC